jgi:multiple sugar transport system substrate-binding protein
MKKYTHKALMCLAASAMAFSLSACSGGGDKPAASNGNAGGDATAANTVKERPKEKVTIEYWHTYSDQEEKVLTEEIKPLFEKQNPGIELKLTRMPTENLKQQVIAGVSGNAAPDLMRMDIVWVPEFAKMGALADVSKMDSFNEVKSKLFEGPLATNFYNNSYYGLPVNTNTKVAIYNKKLLQEAGLNEPPKTMQELETAAKALQQKGYKGTIGAGGANMWALTPYFWSLGGKLTSDDYKKVDGIVNSPESVKALETLIRWKKDGIAAPTILGGEPGTWDGMKNDRYLLIDDGPWFYSILMNDKNEKRNPMDYTVRALIPAGDGGTHSVIGGEDLVIFANSKHPKEAWTFAKWMMGEEPQKLMSKTGLIPTNKAAANDPKFLEVPFVKEYVKQMETALPRTPIPQWGEMEDILNKSFEKALRGEKDAKAALDDAAKQIEAVLKK